MSLSEICQLFCAFNSVLDDLLTHSFTVDMNWDCSSSPWSFWWTFLGHLRGNWLIGIDLSRLDFSTSSQTGSDLSSLYSTQSPTVWPPRSASSKEELDFLCCLRVPPRDGGLPMTLRLCVCKPRLCLVVPRQSRNRADGQRAVTFTWKWRPLESYWRSRGSCQSWRWRVGAPPAPSKHLANWEWTMLSSPVCSSKPLRRWGPEASSESGGKASNQQIISQPW